MSKAGLNFMSDDCCRVTNAGDDKRYRRVLYIALLANLAMFIIEIIAGWYAGSTSLLADAMDFLGDSINYSVSLFALFLPTIWRSRVALIKGIVMGSYGLIIIFLASVGLFGEHVPLASVMGTISLLALAVNVGVARLLYKFRQGDSNQQSVWLCSRNDAIVNIAVIIAAIGVALTQQRWPDLVVAVCIGVLGLSSGYQVIKKALLEFKQHHH